MHRKAQNSSQERNKRNKYKIVSVIEPKECTFCKSKNIVRAGFRFNHTTKKQRWKCNSCKRFFTVDDGFFKMKHKREVVTNCLDLYMNGMSLRKIREHFNQFSDYTISHQSILNLIIRYSYLLKDFQSRFNLNLGKIYHADEIFVRCKKEQHYFWDIIDRDTRFLLATHYSTLRDGKNATKLFKKMKERPIRIFTDGLASYKIAYKKTFGRRRNYNYTHIPLRADVDKRNNIIERIQGTIRERIKVMRGFKNKESAEAILNLFVIYYNFIRIHQGIRKTPIEEAGINLNLGKNKWLDLIYKSKSEII